MRLFARRSENFTVPQPPRHFLYKRQDRIEKREAPTEHGRARRFLSRKISAIALKEERSFGAWIT